MKRLPDGQRHIATLFGHRLQDFQQRGVDIGPQLAAGEFGVAPDNFKRAADIAAQAVVQGIQVAAEVGRQMQLATDFIVKLFQ
jgi:hypothetical protein